MPVSTLWLCFDCEVDVNNTTRINCAVFPGNSVTMKFGGIAEINDPMRYAYVIVTTGANRIQTYAIESELRAIAHAATLAADELALAAQECAA